MGARRERAAAASYRFSWRGGVGVPTQANFTKESRTTTKRTSRSAIGSSRSGLGSDVKARATCSRFTRLTRIARLASSLKPEGTEPLQEEAASEEEGTKTEASLGLVESFAAKSANFGLLGVWAVYTIYTTKFAPDAASVTDRALLEGVLNMGVDSEGGAINKIVYSLFFLMGGWSAIYASLLLPTGKSGNKIPAWPFLSLSVFLGTFSLLPYFALWSPCPPQEIYRQGPSKLSSYLESKLSAGLLLCYLVYFSSFAFAAGAGGWVSFFALFAKSKFTHVVTLDFLVLTLLAPFWVFNDAEMRKWNRGDTLLSILSFLPLYGPAIYLLLRPKLPKSSSAGVIN